MPQILRTIDEIAVTERRGVLFLKFFLSANPFGDFPTQEDIASHASRQIILAWLAEERIGFEECFFVDSGSIIHPYLGDIYLDTPYDEALPSYRVLADFLEDESGKCRFVDTQFCFLSLDLATQVHERRKFILKQEFGE